MKMKIAVLVLLSTFFASVATAGYQDVGGFASNNERVYASLSAFGGDAFAQTGVNDVGPIGVDLTVYHSIWTSTGWQQTVTTVSDYEPFNGVAQASINVSLGTNAYSYHYYSPVGYGTWTASAFTSF
ncbi:hypothetical protein I6N90_17070 [Paenibacillus sp. GSMTC-2017]|nr:hypothetical protein [Paenibacillus sp. GSMTC-2017]